MRILVTNDDGIASPGLWALAREMDKVGEVLVVAPNRDMSGSAAAMMLRRPVRVRQARPPRGLGHIAAYSVVAPPATCTLLGLRGAVGDTGIDLVVSGVNGGANVGRDALLSGTVGAAFVAALEGVPSIAVSTADRDAPVWSTAAMVAGRLAERLREAPVGNILLNVNAPSLPWDAMAGAKITRLSRHCCLAGLAVVPDGLRPSTFRLMTDGFTLRGEEEGSDDWAVANGYISITPLLPEVGFDPANQGLLDWVADLIPRAALAEAGPRRGG